MDLVLIAHAASLETLPFTLFFDVRTSHEVNKIAQ
jgi:hypothetical protein